MYSLISFIFLFSLIVNKVIINEFLFIYLFLMDKDVLKMFKEKKNHLH